MKEKIKIEIPEKTQPPEIIEDVDILEINGKSILIKIQNDLPTIIKVRKILEVYEEELSKSKPLKDLPALPEVTTSSASSKVIEIETPEVETQTPEIIKEQKIIEVKPYGESYDVCPLCSGKLKKKKLKRVGDVLKQRVVCKKRKCNFEREYVFSI